MSLIFALALALQDNGTGGPGLRWRNIDRTPGFRGWREAVRAHYLKWGSKRVNHLCVVVGIDPASGAERSDTVFAYIYSPEARTIQRLSATDEPVPSDLLFDSGEVDLRRDIIDPRQPVNLDPYAVTRGWADRLIARCRRIGTSFTVVRHRLGSSTADRRPASSPNRRRAP